MQGKETIQTQKVNKNKNKKNKKINEIKKCSYLHLVQLAGSMNPLL